MGCAQNREQIQQSIITHDIKYLLPDLEKSIRLAQQCIYSIDSPIQLTPIKQVGEYLCKIERFLPSGSVKMRGAYHMLYRLFEKKRHQRCKQLNVVLPSSGNISLACIESLKKLQSIKLNQEASSIQSSDLMQDGTPTDPGLSAEINDQVLQSNVRPFELLGEVVLFCDRMDEQNELLNYPGVKVVQTQENKQKNIQLALSYADEHDYEFFDQYNDVDVIGGYATVAFEIDQWQRATKTKIDYVFVYMEGGGLIAGIATYFRHMIRSHTRVIGVQKDTQQQQYAGMTLSLSICSCLVDEIVKVTNEEIELAQCELSKQGEIAENRSAQAYAGQQSSCTQWWKCNDK